MSTAFIVIHVVFFCLQSSRGLAEEFTTEERSADIIQLTATMIIHFAWTLSLYFASAEEMEIKKQKLLFPLIFSVAMFL
jgi:hypothetical protein